MRTESQRQALIEAHRVAGLRSLIPPDPGWEAPVRGGPSSRDLNEEQKRIDREARLTISKELGHERQQVSAISTWLNDGRDGRGPRVSFRGLMEPVIRGVMEPRQRAVFRVSDRCFLPSF